MTHAAPFRSFTLPHTRCPTIFDEGVRRGEQADQGGGGAEIAHDVDAEVRARRP